MARCIIMATTDSLQDKGLTSGAGGKSISNANPPLKALGSAELGDITLLFVSLVLAKGCFRIPEGGVVIASPGGGGGGVEYG
jgi:hypothetical protein